MGKSSLEAAINIEAEALVEDLKLYGGKPMKFPNSLKTATLNIIWQMVAGEVRYKLISLNRKLSSYLMHFLKCLFTSQFFIHMNKSFGCLCQ